MNLKEGDLVVVLGPLGLKNGEIDTTQLVIGTYIGSVGKNQVRVLLPGGYIFMGELRDICPVSDQVQE